MAQGRGNPASAQGAKAPKTKRGDCLRKLIAVILFLSIFVVPSVVSCEPQSADGRLVRVTYDEMHELESEQVKKINGNYYKIKE